MALNVIIIIIIFFVISKIRLVKAFGFDWAGYQFVINLPRDRNSHTCARAVASKKKTLFGTTMTRSNLNVEFEIEIWADEAS